MLITESFVTITQLEGETPSRNTELIVKAHFNPASLQISHQAKTEAVKTTKKDKSGKDVAGTVNQRTGIVSNLSSIELIFDTTREDCIDVRTYTLKLAKMIYQEDKPNLAPQVQLQWGTFIFTGTIDSMTENLDYFSEIGVPLRATVTLKMTMTPPKQATNSAANGVSGEAGASAGFSSGFSAGVSASAGISASASASLSASSSFSAGAAVGTTGLKLAQSGESLQAMSARAGQDWKAVAEANGIDNPRFLQAGAVVNLNASAEAKLTFNS